jgi:hypothetical protein
MSDDKRSSTIAITAAIIRLVGVLGGAVISNWDKLGLSRRGGGPIKPFRPIPRSGVTTLHRMGPILAGINLQGSDFSPTPLLVRSADECSEKCEQTEGCLAMTFVKSANQFAGGDCWLKYAVPQRSSAPNMASAIKERR